MNTEEIRTNLARDLWAEYQKPETDLEDKIAIAALLVELTD